MWCCITLCYPEQPPVPETLALGTAESTGTSVKPIISYGGYLLDARFNWCDWALHLKIIECLAHHPEDRPSLDNLMSVITSRRQYEASVPNSDGMTDQELRNWVAGVLFEPPTKEFADFDAYAAGTQGAS
jgi:hypothetical protein